MSAPEKLAALRHLLAARFPSVPRPTGRTLGTGIAALDEVTGGLPLGALTEIVCTAPSCGSHLLLGQLLASTRLTRTRVALIDSTDSFDPASFEPDLLAHLVWVRCTGATTSPAGWPAAASAAAGQASPGPVAKDLPPLGSATASALHAADILARDANLGLIILDLRGAPLAELRRTPPTRWYRLQRAVESADLAFVIETPHACVPSAHLRFVLATFHGVEALERERPVLTSALAPRLQRQRLHAAAG